MSFEVTRKSEALEVICNLADIALRHRRNLVDCKSVSNRFTV